MILVGLSLHHSVLCRHRGQTFSKLCRGILLYLKWTVDELHAIICRLDLAQAVEPLDELAAIIREEMLSELKLRNINELG
jgi:hypothetical protein